MSVPFALNGTCPIAADEPGQQIQDPSAEMILLHDSLTSLSSRLQATLIDSVQQTSAEVSGSQLVQTGELYAGPNGYTTATQPLKATLHFQFDAQATGDQPYLIAGEVCQQLCIVPWQYLPSQKIVSPTEEWLALAFITASWDYATGDGHVIVHGQPIDLAGAGSSEYPVLLRIMWNGAGWDVKALIGPDQVPPMSLPVDCPMILLLPLKK